MKKLFSIIIISITLFSLVSFAFAQERELETKYPEIAGEQPEQVTTPVTKYFKYIFNFLIWIGGIVALMGLIIGGILYLTSAGEPEKLNRAKKQILATFLGLVILFSSYLVLRTVNPDLVNFEMPSLEPIPRHPLDVPPPEAKVPRLLAGVEEIAEQIKENILPGIELSSQRIKDLTDSCDCNNTQPLCFCTGGSDNSSCQPRNCYAGPGFQPCPNQSGIKENQQRVIAWKDEILYYRNRALSEQKDLLDEIEKVLDEKIVYYTRNIIIEEDDKIIEDLREKREKITIEKNLKKDLADKLEELTNLIKEIEPFMLEIGALPDKCLRDEGVYGVNNKCNAHCEGGCHDVEDGCRPTSCDGGNPCPINEINDQLMSIQGLRSQIMNRSDEILNLIDEVIEHKTIII